MKLRTSTRIRDESAGDFTRSSVAGVDALPALAVSTVLAALVTMDPVLASQLVREDALVEWLQVVLAIVAAGFVISARLCRFSPADVLLCALLFALAASEIDLDQHVFGMPVVDPRFFRGHAASWPAQALAGSLIAGVPLALLAYAIRWWRRLQAEARHGLRDGWVRLLVTGLVFIGIAQAFERDLNRLLPLPKYFLEESLELLGTVYLAWAMQRRLRAARRRAEQPEALVLPRTTEIAEPD